MSHDDILSSLANSPTSDFIYSSLSFFGGPRGGPVTGVWFVNALGELGIAEQAVRQTLFRMRAERAITGRKIGRVTWYRATPTTMAIMQAGRERVAKPANEKWDGQWTLVHFRAGDREHRDRLRDILLVEGFGTLAPGLYIHPRDRTARLIKAARELGEHVFVFRGVTDQPMIHEAWDLAAIAARYRAFIHRFAPIARLKPAPKDAFGLRFAFMFEFFRISWDDPSLPHELLPAEWPGEKARRLAHSLAKKLTPGALEFAKHINARGSVPSPR